MGLILTGPQLRRLTLSHLRSHCEDLALEFSRDDAKETLVQKLQNYQRQSPEAASFTVQHAMEWTRQQYATTGDYRYRDANQSLASLLRDGAL